MGWCTTADLDTFVAAAGGYLRSTAVENTLLLSAAQAAAARPGSSGPGSAGPGSAGPGQAGPGLLFGWWEPPDGSEPRGAFLHDPSVPLIIAGRAPEMAAALAGTLAKLQRSVCGVDGPVEAADAFAAAWSHRAGATVRMHKNTRVYRLVAGAGVGGTGVGGAGLSGAPGEPWVPPESQGPAGRLRVATRDDYALVVDWLTAYATEMGERIGSARELAADLIGYGGALIWESPQRTSRFRDAAQHLVGSHHRDAAHRDAATRDAATRDAASREPASRDTAVSPPGYHPAALATLTRPIAGTVRIDIVYTPPDRRRNGYAAAITLAASRAVLEGFAPQAVPGNPHAGSQVVMITDRNRPDRRVARLGYQLAGERAVLRFGPPTGALPRARATGPMPRLPTGPLPRFRH